ncbi:hypothetical protein XA68_17071 [Ophiocordyceps unilateralis]|uniref:Uncharacterized protein n=1 Tax=Ophiocordyceps unilateralis TaxID=268505 RepID=A0A2A9P3M9_OPHUN|nr:hypothetical protein XA68_17071 [Ophiocordyceps unilateralis]
MNEFKGIVKKGWHPEKEGTTLRGQVSNLVNRGKDNPPSNRQQHASRPLTDLVDPSSFAPPPRRAAAAPASPPVSGPHPPRRVMPAPSKMYDPRAARNQSFASASSSDSARPQQQLGMGDDSLPPPPPPYVATSAPPRLPPRRTTVAADEHVSPKGGGGSGGYLDGCLNPAATSRLGAAGISVPGLGIGSPAGAQPTSPSAAAVPSEGTTWAQKQSALKTAASFHKDPSSVSLNDARSAASTANNFRQRHGDQVKAGWERTNSFNQKHGVTEKVGAFVDKHQLASAGGKKAPPPPPPKKKPSIGGFAASDSGGQRQDGPPPIPSSSRPNF